VQGGVCQRSLHATDERYVYLLPDTGHLASGGADVVDVCKSYSARLACVHLKDFTPRAIDGNAPKAGNVPFGEGSVDLAGVIQLLREIDFGGFVMSESGGTNQQMRDYMVHALGLSI
jgi:inosose dehydratase